MKFPSQDLQTKIQKLKATNRSLAKQIEYTQECAHFCVFRLNLQTEKISVSEGMVKLLEIQDSYTIKTLHGYLQFILPNKRKEFLYNFRQLKSINIFHPQYFTIKTCTGKLRQIYVYGKIVEDKTKQGKILKGVVQDVTDTMYRHEISKYHQQLFKAAFEYSSMAILLVSQDGRCIDVNQVACEITGYSRSEILKQNFVHTVIHPDDLERSTVNMRSLITKESKYKKSEKRLVRKDGNIVWTLFSKSVVWLKDPSASYFIFQFIDITDSRRLLKEVELKNFHLDKVNHELQYHIDQNAEFNRIVAHDLKGPASSLIQIVEFLDSASGEEKEFFLNKIKDLSKGILQTLEDVRNVIEVKLTPTTENSCNFRDAIEHSLHMLDMQVKQTAAQINTSLQCESIKFPEVYLKSIMFNLISNALKYRNENEKPLINISAYRHRDNVVMEVSDNGIGIDLKKHKTEVFKYKRVFHKGYDSYGLGLFLTRTQLEAFGGSIDIESKPAHGTKFTLKFKS